MSRALAVAQRRPRDAYATPEPLAFAICARLARAIDAPAHVIEPSAGLGPFVRAARRYWPAARITAVEIDPRLLARLGTAGAQEVIVRDWVAVARRFAAGAPPAGHRLIVGNPPYRHAQAHIEAALSMMRPGDTLALLLRINFLGATQRVEFWRRCRLSEVWPIAPRPSFTEGGSDGTEYAVFVWRMASTALITDPIVWEPKRRRPPVKLLTSGQTQLALEKGANP